MDLRKTDNRYINISTKLWTVLQIYCFQPNKDLKNFLNSSVSLIFYVI